MKNKTNPEKKRKREGEEAVDDNPTVELYPDVLLEIFSRLGARKKSHIAQASPYFGTLFDNNSAWKKRFEKHFPRRTPQRDINNGVNYKSEYYAAQDHEYAQLTKRSQDILYFIKEGDADKLISMNLTYNELTESDINLCTVHEWALLKGNQRILNYFYQISLDYYLANSENNRISPDQVDEYGFNLLHKAIFCQQDASYIEKLIRDNHFDVNGTIASGHTPLIMAVTTNAEETAATLIRLGANVNLADSEGRKPLAFAAANGRTNMIHLLLSHKAGKNVSPNNNGQTAVWEACKNGHDNCLNALLDHGAQASTAFNQQTPLYIAAKNGHDACVRTLIQRDRSQLNIDNNNGRTPLFAAATRGHHHCVQALMDANADTSPVDSNGETVVYATAKQGHEKCMRILERYRADMDQILDEEDGMTALMIAAANSEADAVCMLLNHDADPSAINPHNHATALHYAIMSGCCESMQMLLESGADAEAEFTPTKAQYLQLLTSRWEGRDNYSIQRIQNMNADRLAITPFDLAQDFEVNNTLDVLINHYQSQRPSFF